MADRGPYSCCVKALIFLILHVPCIVCAVRPGFKFKAVNLGGWLVSEGWIAPSLIAQIQNNTDLLDGNKVNLWSPARQKFLTAEKGGGSFILANRDTASAWETFTLTRITGTEFQFQVYNKKYIGLTSDGQVTAEVDESTAETFEIIRNPDGGKRIHIRASTGKYLQAKTEMITADLDAEPGWGDDTAVFLMNVTKKFEGEYQITKGLGPRAQQVMQEHWDTFITENDFAFMKEKGFNDSPSLAAVELMNEPNPQVPANALLEYYKRGYDMITSNAPSAYVIMPSWGNENIPAELVALTSGRSNVVVDVHFYNLYSPEFSHKSAEENIEYIYTTRKSMLSSIMNSVQLVFVGEWAIEMGTADATREDHQNFTQAQLEVFGSASFGWAIWTYRKDGPSPYWSLRDMLQQNFISLQ